MAYTFGRRNTQVAALMLVWLMLFLFLAKNEDSKKRRIRTKLISTGIVENLLMAKPAVRQSKVVEKKNGNAAVRSISFKKVQDGALSISTMDRKRKSKAQKIRKKRRRKRNSRRRRFFRKSPGSAALPIVDWSPFLVSHPHLNPHHKLLDAFGKMKSKAYETAQLDMLLLSVRENMQAFIGLRSHEYLKRANIVYATRAAEWTKAMSIDRTCHPIYTRCDLDSACIMQDDGNFLCMLISKITRSTLIKHRRYMRRYLRWRKKLEESKAELFARGTVSGEEYSSRAQIVLKHVRTWTLSLKEGDPCIELGERCSLGLVCVLDKGHKRTCQSDHLQPLR